MKLHEFQTKAIFRREGIPLPAAILSSSPAQAKQAASEIGYPVILKAQSLLSGRGKVGGIRLTHNDEETELAAGEIFGIKLRGVSIQNILVEKAMIVKNELFIGIYYSPSTSEPCLVLSNEGGFSLEARNSFPDTTSCFVNIDHLLGLQAYMVRQACASLRIEPGHWKTIEQIALKLWKIFVQYDATLAEINSLIFEDDGSATALDGKLIIDDNALFRQREFAGFHDPAITSFAQAEARKFGHKLVRMEGNVAVIANGQGLASATVDMLHEVGLQPALVLILDNGAMIVGVSAACRILQEDPSVKAVLLNVFSNMTNCDDIAKGILLAQTEMTSKKPYVIRLQGSHCDEAKVSLREMNHLHLFDDLFEAVQMTAEIVEKTDAHSH